LTLNRTLRSAACYSQGDQIGWFFTNWATFWTSLWCFEKMK